MSPRSDQRGQFFTTAKTHNFQYIEDISLGSLRLRPIIDQAETYIYNTSKFVVKYISPLSKNELSITATLSFP